MITIKKSVALVSALAVSLVLSACATGPKLEPAKNGYNKQKVVYHLNDVENSKAALQNVKNHLNAVGAENIEIIVVTHGEGAFTLVDGSTDSKGNKFTDMVGELANNGVKFQICANTIRGKKIDESKINMNAQVVPSGVAQVAHLQQLGYLYVKP